MDSPTDPCNATRPPDADAALISDDMLDAPAAAPVRAIPVAGPGGPAEHRTDFERGMSYFPPLTLVLIVANVAVFGWELASGALQSEEGIVAAGALHRERVLGGEVWRVFTATFLHGGFDHLLGNCLMLWIVGMALEHGVGLARTAAVYFVSGLGASLLSLAAHPGPSVGASGAIFGVTAAVVAFLYKYHRLFVVRDKRVGFVLGVWALYQIGIGFMHPLIDNAAHTGGAVCGALLVLLMRPKLARVAAVPAARAPVA